MNNPRPYRVGESVRHALAAALQRGDSPEPELYDVAITVTEVAMSPDLRHATAYVMPLGGKDIAPIMAALKRATPFFRKTIAKEVNLRYAPELRFEADNRFEQAQRLDELLKKI